MGRSGWGGGGGLAARDGSDGVQTFLPSAATILLEQTDEAALLKAKRWAPCNQSLNGHVKQVHIDCAWLKQYLWLQQSETIAWISCSVDDQDGENQLEGRRTRHHHHGAWPSRPRHLSACVSK